jgi:glycosyltransferase involved in cell wall biosynthesis
MGDAADADLHMKIAILGTRGIPGNYGGFETFAEELSTRLVQRGHEVTVYCRAGAAGNWQRSYRGVRLVHLPALRTKYTETLSHTLLSALHSLAYSYDIVYVCNSANSPLCMIPYLRGQRVVLNVDGLEWQRQKWGSIAKLYYRWAARLAARLPIEVVTDARVIQDYYRRQFGRVTRCFAYGTELYERGHLADRVRRLGLEPDRYFLYVSRMEPENNAKLVVQAYAKVQTDLPLVMVGDAPYGGGYMATVKKAADSRVRFLGFCFGDDYHALQSNARAYIQGTEVGGTHPALVEAMGHRNAIVAHDVPEHREVLADAGLYFAYRDADDLAERLKSLLGDPRAVSSLRERAAMRVGQEYSWDSVASAYERYFRELVSTPS